MSSPQESTAGSHATQHGESQKSPPSLMREGMPPAVLAPAERLNDPDPGIRQTAVEELIWMPTRSKEVVLAVVALLDDQDSGVRWAAADTLQRDYSLPVEVIQAVVARLKDQTSEVRRSAMYILAAQDHLCEETIQAVAALLDDQTSEVRQSALHTLGTQNHLPEEILQAVAARLKDQTSEVRRAAVYTLGTQKHLPEETLQAVAALLDDQTSEVRRSALHTLGNRGSMLPDSILKAIEARLKDQAFEVQQAAEDALGRKPYKTTEVDLHNLSLWVKDRLGDKWGNQVRKYPGSQRPEIELDLSPMFQYLRSELVPLNNNEKVLQALRDAIAVTGDYQDAFCCTASQYVEWQWGRVGLKMLEKLSSRLSMIPPIPILRDPRGHEIANSFQYDISGQSSQDVADTLRVLIWVSGAIRDLEKSKRRVMSYSPAILYYKYPMRFTIDWEESELGKFEGTAMPVGTCWNTTFRHFNVATSFPIPPRPVGFVGLEAPLGLVSDLAQIEYMLPYLDTFVLKGERTLLIPLDYNTDASKKVTEIQWHLVEASNGQLLSMDTDDGYEPSNLGCLGPDDYNRILKSQNIRHFVGLYQEASLHFGTAESSSRGIDSVVIGRDGVTSPSGRSAGWQRTFSISSSISLPAFGSIGVSTTFKPVRRNTRALNVDRSLESWVRLACKNITLLYDVRTKTAWLVPEICAIFHLMKAWIIYLEPPANPLLMFPTSSEIHLDLAGEQQHCVNFTRQLSEEHRKILEEFFKAFRMLKEDIIFRSKGPRLRFANFCGQSGRLTGVDFQQLASLPEIVTPLNVKINDRTGGPWIEMLEANWNKALESDKAEGREPAVPRLAGLSTYPTHAE